MDEKIRDFSVAHEPIRFTIDDDSFQCHPAIPAGVLIQFAIEADKINDADMAEQGVLFERLFRMVLQPESADLFLARMDDFDRPITIKQTTDTINWLMEAHGLRPTQPPGNSSAG